jgi:hypothetical protein
MRCLTTTLHPIFQIEEYAMSSHIKFLQSLALMMALAASGMASAETQWEKSHPRRDQVNDRLAVQNLRIHNQVKQGDLTKSQAVALHKDDHQIRLEERAMASQNNGHITKSEQRVLNQQENAVSKQIGK